MQIVVPPLPGKAYKRQLPWVSADKGERLSSVNQSKCGCFVCWSNYEFRAYKRLLHCLRCACVCVCAHVSMRFPGMFAPDFIEERRKGLEDFINKYVLLVSLLGSAQPRKRTHTHTHTQLASFPPPFLPSPPLLALSRPLSTPTASSCLHRACPSGLRTTRLQGTRRACTCSSKRTRLTATTPLAKSAVTKQRTNPKHRPIAVFLLLPSLFFFFLSFVQTHTYTCVRAPAPPNP